MAKTVRYYTAVTTNRGYILYQPDGNTGGVQYERGTVIHLAANYNTTMQYSRYRVISPMDGWINWWIVGSITPVYDTTVDACYPPTKVVLNIPALTLNISGGKGGDLNAMTGYQIQWRERSISNLNYAEWSTSQTVKSSGIASITVTVNPGKARQYRVRTIGKAGTQYYSKWVECAAELFSSALETQSEESEVITLHVFDSELNYTGRVENWISMTWEEEYQGEGAFTLTVPDTDKYAKLLQRGCFIYRNDRSTIMMTVNVERNGEQNQINVGGYTALHMLDYRMVYNKRWVTNIEEAVYKMVSDSLRGLPLKCAESKGFENSVEEEIIDCPMLLETVLYFIKEGDLGARTVFDPETREITFELYQGNDRTYGTAFGQTFSTEFGNLYSIIVVEDDDMLKNVAVVTGANPGCDKTTFTYEAEEGLTGLARRELLVDGEPRGTTGEVDEEGNEIERTHAEWKKAMLDKGKQALTDWNLVQTFEVKPYAGNYGKRYFLGDKVTCKSGRYGLQFDARITQVKERYDEKERELTMTLGEPTINYIKKELKTHG